MKKTLLLLGLSVTGINSSFASPALERALLINDFETWLRSEKSLFDWGGFRDKEVRAFNDIKQPAHIYRDFKINSIAAEEKYKSIQRFSGHISSVEKNDYGDPILVFDIGYVDKIYVNGLTRNEVIDLKVPNRVSLLCVGFKMDFAGDISATCSMFDDPVRFVAVNNIQLFSKINKSKFPLDIPTTVKAVMDKKIESMSKEIDLRFNKDCRVIDSINYSNCFALIKEVENNKKAP